MLSSSDDLRDRCLPLSGGFFITTTLLSKCGGDLWATLCFPTRFVRRGGRAPERAASSAMTGGSQEGARNQREGLHVMSTVDPGPATRAPSAARAQGRQLYVLVHGAWHGGWCWARVAERLRAAGHRVFTPTLTGLGDRVHLIGPNVGLGTCIEDVVSTIDMEDLSDVVLVGHSFGSAVISGVADARPDLIRRLVFLDSFVVQSGQSPFNQLPKEMVEARRASPIKTPGLYRETLAMPPPAPNDWSRTTCDHTALRRASSDLNAGASAGDGKTIERRIHTSRPGGGSARCSASRAPAPRRSFFQPTPPSTTSSTYNAISSQPKPTVRFALRR